jgi:hypothetical protein
VFAVGVVRLGRPPSSPKWWIAKRTTWTRTGEKVGETKGQEWREEWQEFKAGS